MHRWWVHYVIAVAAVAAVALLRTGLEQVGAIQRTPFVLFVVPTVLASWRGGFGPGMFATFVSAAAISILFFEPVGSWQVARHELVPLVLFLAEGAFISWLADTRLRMLDDLNAYRRELEQRVVSRTAELREANTTLHQTLQDNELVTEELRLQSEQLQRSNRELQDFASVASHDLQEPLRKIQAFGDRLKVRCAEQLSADGLDYLARMQAAAGRMQVLINDLLTFSRVTTRAQPFQPVDLAEIVGAVLSDFESRIEQTGGRVEVGDLPTIDADPTQMRQVFQNLISNGLKFHREGEPPVVRISSQIVHDPEGLPTTDGEPFCEIRIADNGIGFEEKYLDRIFEIFQRLHGRNVYEGTGIGLAVCRKIVERHGGRITAESRPEQGATFIVTLPVRHPSPSGETTEPDADAAHAPAHYDPVGR